jgi:hypothetical protein
MTDMASRHYPASRIKNAVHNLTDGRWGFKKRYVLTCAFVTAKPTNNRIVCFKRFTDTSKDVLIRRLQEHLMQEHDVGRWNKNNPEDWVQRPEDIYAGRK